MINCNMTWGWSVGYNRWITCGWDTCDWLLCEVRGVRRSLCRWRCVCMWTTVVCDVLCLGVHGHGYSLRWWVMTWMVWHLIRELMLWDSRDTEGGNVVWRWLWISRVSVPFTVRTNAVVSFRCFRKIVINSKRVPAQAGCSLMTERCLISIY